jgi:hypothetical protein
LEAKKIRKIVYKRRGTDKLEERKGTENGKDGVQKKTKK